MEQKKVGTVIYPDWIERAKKMLINKKSDKRYKEFCVLLCEMILNEGKIPEGLECDNLVKTYLDTANRLQLLFTYNRKTTYGEFL